MQYNIIYYVVAGFSRLSGFETVLGKVVKNDKKVNI
jgi:hypothetical protein